MIRSASREPPPDLASGSLTRAWGCVQSRHPNRDGSLKRRAAGSGRRPGSPRKGPASSVFRHVAGTSWWEIRGKRREQVCSCQVSSLFVGDPARSQSLWGHCSLGTDPVRTPGRAAEASSHPCCPPSSCPFPTVAGTLNEGSRDLFKRIFLTCLTELKQSQRDRLCESP